jgi:hypothetical protein
VIINCREIPIRLIDHHPEGLEGEKRANRWRKLVLTPVGVEKGTKAVISTDSSVYGERTFNNLRTDFVVEIARREFFNSHAC